MFPDFLILYFSQSNQLVGLYLVVVRDRKVFFLLLKMLLDARAFTFIHPNVRAYLRNYKCVGLLCARMSMYSFILKMVFIHGCFGCVQVH